MAGHCRDCGRYFNQRFPGILPYYHSTEVYSRYVFQKHMDKICRKTLAEREWMEEIVRMWRYTRNNGVT